jgi:hypothetical protein
MSPQAAAPVIDHDHHERAAGAATALLLSRNSRSLAWLLLPRLGDAKQQSSSSGPPTPPSGAEPLTASVALVGVGDTALKGARVPNYVPDSAILTCAN